MTVKQLITILEKYDPEQVVLFGASGRDEDYYDETILAEDKLVSFEKDRYCPTRNQWVDNEESQIVAVVLTNNSLHTVDNNINVFHTI